MFAELTAVGPLLADLAWVVLDGGHAHEDGGVALEPILFSVVALLGVVGGLYYFGYLGSPDAGTGEGTADGTGPGAPTGDAGEPDADDVQPGE